jgi:hypothetical protein
MYSDNYTNHESCLAFLTLIPKWRLLFYFEDAFATAELYAANCY